MGEMKALGCRFALDDFGAGASSFSYLQNLPVDYLKIDASFVTEMASNPVKEAMVRAINQIGHVMNIKTIAEGVESMDLLPRLGAMGVDYAQGYAIGIPRAFAPD
jgi:EAL domain-containing protein (putative c-di-GMP-specific phosphodiesterase class I)